MAAAVMTRVLPTKSAFQQRYLSFTGNANPLDNSGVQDIFELDVSGIVRIAARLVVATANLAAFQIKAIFHQDDTVWTILRSTTAQFTTPSGVFIEASGDLSLLAVGSGYFIMDCAGLSKVRLAANSSAASSTLALFGSGV